MNDKLIGSNAKKSGKKLEDGLGKFLTEKRIPFKQQKSGKHEIDFIISDSIYADCTNQNRQGSVEDKIPHKIWKYFKKYNYKEVYIVRGDYIPNHMVLQHCEDIAKENNFKFHIVTLKEFCDILEDKSITSPLEKFLKIN